MRRFALVAVLLVAACSLQRIDWQTGTFQSVIDLAQKRQKPILVYFSSPTCTVCRFLEKSVFQDRRAARVIRRQYVLFRVVKGVGEGDRLIEFFQISAFPTLVVMGVDARERDRIIGFNGDAAALIETLADWAVDRHTLLSYLRRFSEDTTEVEYAYRIAERYLKRGQDELAAHFFARVRRLDPQNRSGYKPAADFYAALFDFRRLGNDSLLIAVLRQETDAERLLLGYRSLISAEEGRALSGDAAAADRAISLYQEALRRLPDSVLLMNACAWFIHQAKLREHTAWGIRLAERAASLAPNSEEIWDTLAWLYHDAGRYEDAVAAMKRAAGLNPKAEYYKQALQQMQRAAGR